MRLYDHAVYGARVELGNEAAVTTWCKRLRCSPLLLRQAVQRVGNQPEDVASYVAAYTQVPKRKRR